MPVFQISRVLAATHITLLDTVISKRTLMLALMSLAHLALISLHWGSVFGKSILSEVVNRGVFGDIYGKC